VLNHWSHVVFMIVPVAGILYLFVTRRRSRRASALAVVGLIVLLSLRLFQALFGYEVFRHLIAFAERVGAGRDTVIHTYWVVLDLIQTLGIALLVVAVMTDRRGPAPGDD
jgi:hypothetical protein